jgi:23S rRNA pseudouridine2605 synthase
VYLLLNKPPEVVSTMSDPEGRPSLRDFLHGVSERVFPVGRLEYHSTGLVLLTNDGDLANRILQSNDLRQTYQLKLKTLLTFAEIEGLSRATGAHITRLRGKEMPWYEVTLSEARRDALRNKLFQTGHPVDKMRRVGMGNLKLEGLASGRHREVSAAEVATLIRLLDGKETVAADRPPKRPAKPPKFPKFAKFAKSTKFTRPTRSAKSAKSAQSKQFTKHKQQGAGKKFRPHSSPRR